MPQFRKNLFLFKSIKTGFTYIDTFLKIYLYNLNVFLQIRKKFISFNRAKPVFIDLQKLLLFLNCCAIFPIFLTEKSVAQIKFQQNRDPVTDTEYMIREMSLDKKIKNSPNYKLNRNEERINNIVTTYQSGPIFFILAETPTKLNLFTLLESTRKDFSDR